MSENTVRNREKYFFEKRMNDTQKHVLFPESQPYETSYLTNHDENFIIRKLKSWRTTFPG